MENEVKEAIKALAEKLKTNVASDEAMRYSQAALNLAHTLQVLKQTSST